MKCRCPLVRYKVAQVIGTLVILKRSAFFFCSHFCCASFCQFLPCRLLVAYNVCGTPFRSVLPLMNDVKYKCRTVMRMEWGHSRRSKGSTQRVSTGHSELSLISVLVNDALSVAFVMSARARPSTTRVIGHTTAIGYAPRHHTTPFPWGMRRNFGGTQRPFTATNRKQIR